MNSNNLRIQAGPLRLYNNAQIIPIEKCVENFFNHTKKIPYLAHRDKGFFN